MRTQFLTLFSQEALVIFAVSLTVLLVTVAGVQGIAPELSRYRLLRAEIDSAQTLVSQSGDYGVLRAQLAQQGQELQNRLDQSFACSGQPADIAGLLQMIVGIATESGVTFVKMQPVAESELQDAGHYPIVLECRETYERLGLMILGLEQNGHLLKIDRLSLSSAGGGKVDARMLVTCFLPDTF